MKKKIVKKPITLDTLAGMVASGFSDMDKRFSDVDKRFSDMENKFDGRFTRLEQDMEEIKLKLDNVAYRFEVQ